MLTVSLIAMTCMATMNPEWATGFGCGCATPTPMAWSSGLGHNTTDFNDKNCNHADPMQPDDQHSTSAMQAFVSLVDVLDALHGPAHKKPKAHEFTKAQDMDIIKNHWLRFGTGQLALPQTQRERDRKVLLRKRET